MTKPDNKKMNMAEPNPADFGLKDFSKYIRPKSKELKGMKSDLIFKINQSEPLLKRLNSKKLDFILWFLGVTIGLILLVIKTFILGLVFGLAPLWGLFKLVGFSDYLWVGFSVLVFVIVIYQMKDLNFHHQSVDKTLDYLLKDAKGNSYEEKIINLKNSLSQIEKLISFDEAFEKYERQKAETGEDWWRALSSYQLEEAVAGLFNRKGYKASVTKKSGDGGIDVIVRSSEKTLLIQCKGWESKVGVKPIREMAGVVVHSKEVNPVGVILSTNGFTVEATKFAKQSQMLLWDSKTLSEIAKDQYEI